MPKIYVIGYRAHILPFRAAGLELIEVENSEGVKEAFEKLMDETEPCTVLVMEDLAEKCWETIETFQKGNMRIVLPIASLTTKPGKRLEKIRVQIARALGVDLLGRDKRE